MFQLSPSEKKGLLLLLGIILIGFIIQWLQPYIINTDLYDYSVQDSVFKSISADTAGSFVALDYQTEKTAGQVSSGISAKPKEPPLPHSININTARKILNNFRE